MRNCVEKRGIGYRIEFRWNVGVFVQLVVLEREGWFVFQKSTLNCDILTGKTVYTHKFPLHIIVRPTNFRGKNRNFNFRFRLDNSTNYKFVTMMVALRILKKAQESRKVMHISISSSDQLISDSISQERQNLNKIDSFWQVLKLISQYWYLK